MRSLTAASMCLALALGGCSSSTGSSGPTETGTVTPDAGTSSPLPVVNVPQLATTAELVPAYHQSLATLNQSHGDFFKAYQALASASPDGDKAAFDAATDQFGAATKALVTAALTANGYSAQFPGLHKDDNPPQAVPQQAVVDIHKLGNSYVDRKAALDLMLQEGKIDQATYDALKKQTWGEFKANFAGGVVGGGAAIGTFLLVGGKAALATGTLVSIAGPALAAVVVGVAVKVTVTYCFKPKAPNLGGTKAFGNKSGALESDEACYFATYEGKVGDTLSVPPGAQVMIAIDGHEPIYLDPATLVDGGAVQVDAQLGDPATGTPNGPPIVTPIDPGSFGTCDKVVSVNAVTEPADPGPGQTVLVHATSVPPVAGCTMKFSIHGTDNFSKAEDETTDASGTGTFSIPGGAAGVVDTVTVSIGGHVSTLVYTF